MRIAYVSGHFMPEIGYQEVYLARAFARLGHDVRVFSSTSVSPSGRKIIDRPYPSGLCRDPREGYDVCRLRSLFDVRTKVVTVGLRRAIEEFAPDLIVANGIAKLFGATLAFGGPVGPARLVFLFGDSHEYVERSTPLQRIRAVFHDLGFAMVKRPIYRAAVGAAHAVVMNVPETRALFERLLRPEQIREFESKARDLRLGFDPEVFHFSHEERRLQREHFGLRSEDILIVTSTRVSPSKRLDKIVDIVSALRADGVPVVLAIVGFLDDNYGDRLRGYMAEQPVPEAFRSLSFLDHEGIRRIFCAGDVGVWTKAAISIQEAMGTGLPVVIPDRPSMSHLVTEGFNGWYYEDSDDLARALHFAVSAIRDLTLDVRLGARRGVESKNHGVLSYHRIAAEIIEMALHG